MKLEITLEKKTLKALLRFAGARDFRYYLNGIALETGPKGARMIATDGHRLAVAKVDGVFPATDQAIIIPRAMLEKIKIGKKLLPFAKLSVTGASHPYTLRLNVDGEEREAAAIDGKFPDWERCFPETFSGELAQLNPWYIGAAGDASVDLGDAAPVMSISYNGTGAALIEYPNHPNFTAIIMPVKYIEPTLKAPAWLKEELDYRFIPRGPEDEAEMQRYQDRLAQMSMDANARQMAQAFAAGGLEQATELAQAA